MDLFKLHTASESPDFYAEADMYVPTLILQKYKDSPKELKERENALATSIIAKYKK